MYCKKCGNYMDDNAQFCPNCGAKQDEQQGYTQNYQQSYQQPARQPAPKVSFPQAVKLFFTRYTDFSGRSRRSEFWWAQLGITVIGYVIAALSGSVEFLGWLATLWSIVILIPGISITVRRLHDVGHKGTYYLWILLPFVGCIMLLVQCCKDSVGDNEWGPSPKY